MNRTPLAAIVAALFLPFPAAQAADAQLPAVQTMAPREGSPNDTVVTGTKTDTPLRDLPASVVVVPSSLIRQQGTIDLNKALENASGVQPVMAGGYGFSNNYTIRGLPMRFLRDGFPDGTSQNGYWHTMYDVERLEVLKGPGSALYGSGQPGGTVNFVSKPPRAGLGGEVGAFYGSFNTRGGYLDTWGSIGPNIQGRFIGDVEKSDGFRGLSRDIQEFSPSFSWKLASDKTLNVDFDRRDLKIKPDNYGVLFDVNRSIAAPRETRYYSPMNFSSQTVDRLSVSHEWRLNSDLTMRTAVINDLRELNLLRNGGGNGGNAAGVVTGRQIRSQSDSGRSSLVQNEFLWKTRTGNVGHTVLAGAEYSDTRVNTVRVGYNLPDIANVYAPVVPETSLAGLAPVTSQGFNRVIRSNDTALYVQDQLELGDKFKLRAGLRGDRVHADDIGAQGTVANRTISVRDTITSGSLGGVWQPTRQLSFYAGYSKGGFVNLSTEPAAISPLPEKSEQREVGAKTTFWDGKADLNLALFDTRRSDYFITLPGAVDPTPDGKDRSRGIELDFGARPMRGVSLLANLVIQKSETLSNAVASNAALGIVNRSIYGTRPAGVAGRAARLWASYDLQSEQWKGWGLGAGVTYKGDSYADSLNLYQVPSYAVMDASVYYRARKWDATLRLANLTDRTYYVSPTFSGALPGESRNALLTVRYRFD